MWSEIGKQNLIWRPALRECQTAVAFLGQRLSPRFSYIQINQHLKHSGRKEIGEKGCKFFLESYIHDVYVGRPSADHADLPRIVQARCHRSQRKNEDPHSLKIEVVNSSRDAKISKAKCSCKARLKLGF